MMRITDEAKEEYAARHAGERAKAVEKYGEAALIPSGAPSREIHDYGINELVGLDRYAEMIEARALTLPADRIAARLSAIEVAQDIRKHARRLALDLIVIRQFLEKQGLLYGTPEQR